MAKRIETRLGTVKIDYEWNYWTLLVQLKAFRQFRYSDRRNRGYSRIPVLLRPVEFEGDLTPATTVELDDTTIAGLTNEQHLTLIESLVANEAILCEEIKTVAWSFFNHIYSEEEFTYFIVDAYEGRNAPRVRSSEDVRLLIGHPRIEIDYGLFARFSFISAMDMEHGLGLATDGSKIIGVGGSLEAYPAGDVVDGLYTRNVEIPKGPYYTTEDLERLWHSVLQSELQESRICKMDGCNRKAVVLSVMCPAHHYQMLTGISRNDYP